MEHMIVAIVFVFLYFLPSFLSINRKYKEGIMLLNLLLGWTFLGWVGALIWAVCSPKT